MTKGQKTCSDSLPLRSGLLLGMALAVAGGGPALANHLTFGTPSFDTEFDSRGNANSQASLVLGGQFPLLVRAVARADQRGFSDAEASVRVTASLPYTISRTVVVDPCCPGPAIANVPIQVVALVFQYRGVLSVRDDIGPGTEVAEASTAIVTSDAGLFMLELDGGKLEGDFRFDRNLFFGLSGGVRTSYETSENLSGPQLGEISFCFEVPTDYRLWEDSADPFAFPYTRRNTSFVQTFSDTLRVDFTLSASSTGFNGGEAIASAGGNDDFGGSGFSLIDSSIVVTGFVQQTIPGESNPDSDGDGFLDDEDRLVASTDDTFEGKPLTRFGVGGLNNSGVLAFAARFGIGQFPPDGGHGIFTASLARPVPAGPVALTGDPLNIDGVPYFVESTGGPVYGIDNSGRVAFSARFNPVNINLFPIRFGASTQFGPLALTGDTIGGQTLIRNPVTLNHIGIPGLSDSGEFMAFLANFPVVGEGVFTKNIFTQNTTALALTGPGQPPVGGEILTGFWGNFTPLVFVNDLGTVAFFAFSSAGDGIFTKNIVTQESTAVALPGDTIGGKLLTQIGPFAPINNSDTVAFSARFRLGTNPTAGKVIFTKNAAVVTKIVENGDTIDGILLHSPDGPPALNDSGRVAFVGALLSGGSGVFTQNCAVAVPGDTVNGKTLVRVGAIVDINDSGAVAFVGFFTDGSSGIVRIPADFDGDCVPDVDDPDDDNDGIFDEVDPDPTFFSGSFSDCPGSTFGTIVFRGNQIVTVRDSLEPAHHNDGVVITADPSGGLAPAILSACGDTFALVRPGDEFIVTCGSTTIAVVTGEVDITFEADDGTVATLTLVEDNGVTFDGSTATLSAFADNPDPVLVLVQGLELVLEPRESIDLAFLLVGIDIKPGSFPNSIRPGSKGAIPVAILTTEEFDATTVDPQSVTFGRGDATEVHGVGHTEDVDGDGDLDLVLHFDTQAAGIQCGDTTAILTAETFGGQLIRGSDSINTVGCR